MSFSNIKYTTKQKANRQQYMKGSSLSLFRRIKESSLRGIGAEFGVSDLMSSTASHQTRGALVAAGSDGTSANYRAVTEEEMNAKLTAFKTVLGNIDSQRLSSSSASPTVACEDPFKHDPALVAFINSQLTNQKSGQRSDLRIHNRTRASTPEGWSAWDEVSEVEKMDTFECNNKQAWIDSGAGWCHLCDEPVGNSVGVHSGDRDHMCLQLFVTIYANYPLRQASPDCRSLSDRAGKVLSTAASSKQLAPIFQYATKPYSQDHLHTQPEAVRRAELTAMLIHLCQPPHNAITHVIQGRLETGFWYSGERMFRREFTRSVSQIMPPLSAGMMTQLTHKCWGRTNLERSYDALQIADIKRMFGGTPLTEKDPKAQFMRLLMWNLMDTPVRTLHVAPELETNSSGGSGWGSSSIDHTELTIELARLARRRLVFELVFLQTMQFMNKAQGVFRRLGGPTYTDLLKMNVT